MPFRTPYFIHIRSDISAISIPYTTGPRRPMAATDYSDFARLGELGGGHVSALTAAIRHLRRRLGSFWIKSRPAFVSQP